MTADREVVLAQLREVKDPELPALDVVELGVVRDVEVDGDAVTVTITPTYSGCPAMRAIEEDIRACLRAHGHAGVSVRTRLSPPWSTDWLGAEARRKLAATGIAPPRRCMEPSTAPACPLCGSPRTRLRSEFGSTACKGLWSCERCLEPFEAIKPV